MILPPTVSGVLGKRDCVLNRTYGLDPTSNTHFPFCIIANQTSSVNGHVPVALLRTGSDSDASLVAMRLHIDPYAAEVLGWTAAAKPIFMEKCGGCIFSLPGELPTGEFNELFGVSDDSPRLCKPRLAQIIPKIDDLKPDFYVRVKGVLEPAVMGVVARVLNWAFPLIYNEQLLQAIRPQINFSYRPLLGLE